MLAAHLIQVVQVGHVWIIGGYRGDLVDTVYLSLMTLHVTAAYRAHSASDTSIAKLTNSRAAS